MFYRRVGSFVLAFAVFAQGPDMPIGGNGGSTSTASAATQQPVAYSAAPAVVLGTGDNVVIFGTLTGNMAPTISGQSDATKLSMVFVQDGTGGRTVTFGANFSGVPSCAINMAIGSTTTVRFTIKSGIATFDDLGGDGALTACRSNGYKTTFPNPSSDNTSVDDVSTQTISGNKNLTGEFKIPGGLFANKPASPTERMIYYASDCLTSACTAGGGTIRTLLRHNGSAWVPDAIGLGSTTVTYVLPFTMSASTGVAGSLSSGGINTATGTIGNDPTLTAIGIWYTFTNFTDNFWIYLPRIPNRSGDITYEILGRMIVSNGATDPVQFSHEIACMTLGTTTYASPTYGTAGASAATTWNASINVVTGTLLSADLCTASQVTAVRFKRRDGTGTEDDGVTVNQLFFRITETQ